MGRTLLTLLAVAACATSSDVFAVAACATSSDGYSFGRFLFELTLHFAFEPADEILCLSNRLPMRNCLLSVLDRGTRSYLSGRHRHVVLLTEDSYWR